MKKATPEQQLRFLARDVLPLLRAVAAGYDAEYCQCEYDFTDGTGICEQCGHERRMSA